MASFPLRYRFGRGGLIVLNCIALSFCAEAYAEKQIFFHWGSPEANRTMLEKGNYTFPSNYGRELHAGGAAALSAPLFDLLRDWYVKDGKRDVAGAGFYMSADAFNSRSFGNDLIIVEVETTKSDAKINFVKDPDIDVASNKALTKNSFDKLPVVATYNSSGWHVITRPPVDSDGIAIHFRPPTATDIESIWSQTERPINNGTIEETRIKFLHDAANSIMPQKGSSEGITRPAEITMHRLLFDEGSKFLNQALNADAASRHRIITDSNFDLIREAYNHWLPDDPRTQQLTKASLRDLVHSSPDKITQVDLFDLKKIVPILTDAEKHELSAMFNYAPKTEIIAQDFAAYLDLVQYFRPFLSTEASAKWKDALSSALKSSELSMPLDDPAMQAALHTEFSDTIRKDLSDRKLSIAYRYLKGMHNNAVERGLPKVAESILKSGGVTQLEQALLHYVQSFSTYDGYRGNPTDAISTLLKWIYRTPALAQNTAFRTKLREILKSAPNWSSVLSDEALSLVRHPNSHEVADGTYKAIVRDLARDFPEEIPSIRHSLAKATEDASYPIDENGISRSLEKWELPEQAAVRLKHEFEAHYPKGTVNMPDLNTFTARVRSLTNYIPRSPEYSEISRIFLLVDPLYVSEDLRRLNAKHPEQRFNESYQHGGKTYHQPTWENFQRAADEFSISSFKLNQNDAYTADVLVDVNRILLTGMIDGAEKAYDPEARWDREKYKTSVPIEEWNKLSSAQIRDLGLWFNVESEGAGKALRFKSAKELGIEEARPGPRYLLWKISEEVSTIQDPIKRAARILHIVPKIHPFENGNGRLARLWASHELQAAGLPIPVGLPTNDFLMSEARIELELRRAMEIGRLWKDELKRAAASGLDTGDFFSKKFKGSPLEGLMHVMPTSDAELTTFVDWLKTQKQAPKWGAELASRVGVSVSGHRRAANMSEIERSHLVEKSWKGFDDQLGIISSMAPKGGDCKSIFEKLFNAQK